MIKSLHNVHEGAVIAVIGSGPSAVMFNPSDCDVSIGVNGAANLTQHSGIKFDYFLCGDFGCVKKPWFQVNCSRARVIYKRIAPLDYQLYPKKLFKLRRKIYSLRRLKKINLPIPTPPHITFDYTMDETPFCKGSRKFEKILLKGSISAMAVQAAYLMGCKEIKLYGCSFSVGTSQSEEHHFYSTKKKHIGSLTEGHIKDIDFILSIVRKHGVKVSVYGDTALTQYDSIVKNISEFRKAGRMILDLGCGKAKHPNTIGADMDPDSSADVVCDFNKERLPFDDNYFDGVISKQVFEHLDSVENVLKEIHRICKNEAKVIIEVPHFSCYLAYGDPTHKRSFSIFSFDELSAKCGFKILVKKINFHKAFRKYKINLLANKFSKSYERFWVFICPAEHLHFELQVIK